MSYTDSLTVIGAIVVGMGSIAITLAIVLLVLNQCSVLIEKIVKNTKYNVAFTALMMKWLRASKEQRKDLVEATTRSARSWELECEERRQQDTELNKKRFTIHLAVERLVDDLDHHEMILRHFPKSAKEKLDRLRELIREADELEGIEHD